MTQSTKMCFQKKHDLRYTEISFPQFEFTLEKKNGTRCWCNRNMPSWQELTKGEGLLWGGAPPRIKGLSGFFVLSYWESVILYKRMGRIHQICILKKKKNPTVISGYWDYPEIENVSIFYV